MKIVKLERIQNKWLWERYARHRERIRLKNNGQCNEMDLFHGTRGTMPSQIFNGEEGFDMRFCVKGLWGIGTYFAEKASYSDSYAHSPSGGTKQMFLAKVLTGHYVDKQPDDKLRMPPSKQDGGGMFAETRYDSVRGVAEGSQVFVVYSNDKSYPYYLITYRV